MQSQSRTVATGHGWDWFKGGFDLFRKAPLIWIVFTIVLLVMAMALSMVPLVGHLLFYFVSPLFVAGLMLGCRDLEAGKDLEIAHLFAGFQKDAAQLVTVGGVYLVGQVLVFGAMVTVGGGVVAVLLREGAGGLDPTLLMEAAGGLLAAALVGMALSVPLLMAVWFAPQLVVLDGVPALAALRLSFSACLRNMLPFLLYGLVVLVAALVAAVPFGLGYLVLVPVLIASAYVSYRDLFPLPGSVPTP